MIPALSDPPLCTLKDLIDGTYDLADVADMIDHLTIRADNAVIAKENAPRVQ